MQEVVREYLGRAKRLSQGVQMLMKPLSAEFTVTLSLHHSIFIKSSPFVLNSSAWLDNGGFICIYMHIHMHM